MALIGIHGSSRDVNRTLLLHAALHGPTLFLDCANCADPHSMYRDVPLEYLTEIKVLQAEVLYKFRDTIARLDQFASKVSARQIIVTTFTGLMAFQNEEENEAIYTHAWEMLSALGASFSLFVGVTESYYDLARMHCDEVVRWDTLAKASGRLQTVSLQN